MLMVQKSVKSVELGSLSPFFDPGFTVIPGGAGGAGLGFHQVVVVTPGRLGSYDICKSTKVHRKMGRMKIIPSRSLT